MHALLIYPKFPDTFWSFKHALKFIRKKAAFPPLGLLTVASMLPEGWSKRLVDTNVTTLTDRDLAWADCAFVSGMTIQRDSAQRIIKRCKAAGLRVVAGGPLFIGELDHFEEVDHFVLNEAELTLPPFLRDLARGCAKRVYDTDCFADIRSTPPPMWKLIDLKKYASLSVQFSRGCPFNCDFCNVTALFGHRVRTKTVEQILAELDLLSGLGWRGQVFFVDDNFIGNKKYLVDQLLPALIGWRRKRRGFYFNTEASLNLADDQRLMQRMVSAGFESVFIGIETPDEAGLSGGNKVQNVKRSLVDSVRRIQRAGLQVQGGFIVGFDTDGPNIFQRQIDFIQQSGIVTAMVGLLQAPPGTKLYERLKNEGRLRGSLSGDNVDGTTNIIPKMDIGQLLNGYRDILQNIYLPSPYYRRVRTFLQEYRAPKLPVRLDAHKLFAFFRSCIRIGIFGRERFHFWRLFCWSLVRHPRFLPMVVTFAIYGHHFRKVCKL